MLLTVYGHWKHLCSKLLIESGVDEAFEDIRRHYAEAHRHYHVLGHIQHCLDEFSPIEPHFNVTNAAVMRAALILHDAIYDPHRQDNEEQSVVYSRGLWKGFGIGSRFVDAVSSHILATKTHRHPGTIDTAYVLDIDLAILGQPADIFDVYERNIRLEYSWVPEVDYRMGRRKVLESLMRPRIYYTRYFQDKYEANAQENLKRSLVALS